MYTVQRGWIDCSGRTRTWKLLDADGNPIAEVTTKCAALRLLELLNGGKVQ